MKNLKKIKIKNILWDYGGVLTYSPFSNIKNYEKRNNIPINSIIKINSVNSMNNAWALLEKNLISEFEFCRMFRIEAINQGIKDINPNEILRCLNVSLNTEMVKLLKLVSKKYSCSCLTNNFSNINAVNKKQFNSLNVYFNNIFESSKIRMRKPEKEIYMYVLEKLSAKPQEIIFIDDLGINLKPARELGIITHKLVNFTETKKFLSDILEL